MSDSDIILKVENLSKTYFSKYQPQRSIKDLFMAPFQQTDETADQVHALKDVSFELKRGESLGIIGSNGAGKSTLLKILSGVTSPSSGKVTINGRVLSVLDIGTGFHPDLTGRENVYLKGQLMGLCKTAIDESIDSIVSFSEIGAFIDSPVKKYSSGMFLRLAFSSLIHLDADLLILDEVLAYGDMAFRNKCVAKFLEIAESDRSIILVSHSMSEVTSLCDKALLLQNGLLAKSDDTETVVASYTKNTMRSVSNKKETQIKDRKKEVVYKDIIEDVSVSVSNAKGGSRIYSEHPFNVEIEFTKPRTEENIEVVLVLRKAEGEPLITYSFGLDPGADYQTTKDGYYQVTYTIPERVLNAGVFFIGVYFAGREKGIYSRHHDVKMIEIESSREVTFNIPSKQRPILNPKIIWRIVSH